MARSWHVEIVLGWAVVAGVLVLVGIVGLLIWLWPRPGSIDPGRIYRACEQYASLDLSGWASICHDVGYQQTTAPEDQDR